MKVKKLLLMITGAMTILLTAILLINGIVMVYSKGAEYSEQTDKNIGNYLTIVVTTPSMTPAINIGSISIVKKYNQEDIMVGDVIMYINRYNENIVHRVIEITELEGQLFFLTKGDANPEPDGVLVGADRFRGKVIVTANWVAPMLKSFIGGTVVEYAVFKLLLVTVIGAYVLYKLIRQLVLFFIALYYIFVSKKSYKKYIDRFESTIGDCTELHRELKDIENIENESIYKKLRRSSHLAKMLDSVDDIKDNKNDMQKRIKKYNKK